MHAGAAVERCMFHGLRTVDGEASFWAFVLDPQMDRTPELSEIVQQVSAVGFLTFVGKSRAWVRAALNSNLVETALVHFIQQQKALADFYEDYSLMRCPEGSQILISMVTALSGGWEFCFAIDDIISLDTRAVILGDKVPPVQGADGSSTASDVSTSAASSPPSDKTRRTWGEFAQTLAASADKAMKTDGAITTQITHASRDLSSFAGKAGQKLSTVSTKLQQEINRNTAHAQMMLTQHRANRRLFGSPLQNVVLNPRYTGAVAELDWRLGVPLLVDRYST
jgi:hypothetical protein